MTFDKIPHRKSSSPKYSLNQLDLEEEKISHNSNENISIL